MEEIDGEPCSCTTLQDMLEKKHYECIALSPDISLDIIEQYKDKLNWDTLMYTYPVTREFFNKYCEYILPNLKGLLLRRDLGGSRFDIPELEQYELDEQRCVRKKTNTISKEQFAVQTQHHKEYSLYEDKYYVSNWFISDGWKSH